MNEEQCDLSRLTRRAHVASDRSSSQHRVDGPYWLTNEEQKDLEMPDREGSRCFLTGAAHGIRRVSSADRWAGSSEIKDSRLRGSILPPTGASHVRWETNARWTEKEET
ncbi:hypothetical protein PO909_015381 [Leuciscus waleckii]